MRKKKSVFQGLMVLALAALLVVTLTGMASAAKKFGLADIPEIKKSETTPYRYAGVAIRVDRACDEKVVGTYWDSIDLRATH